MPTFKYRARTGSGDFEEGLVEAPTENAAVDKLADQGIFPVSMEEAAGGEPSQSDERTIDNAGDSVKLQYMLRGQTHMFAAETLQSSGTERGYIDAVVIVNVGAGGARFTAGTELGKGAIMNIRIDLPDGQQSIECIAKADEVEVITKDEAYNVAVSFMNMSYEDRARIDSCAQGSPG